MSQKTMIDHIIDGIIEREGGYSDHAADRGGRTCWGITEATARRYGYKGDMRDLPVDIARQIYRVVYVIRPRFDRVSKLAPTLGARLADIGANMGPGRAARMLQDALNAFNDCERLYQDLVVDGQLGDLSLSALEDFLKNRPEKGEAVLVAAVQCLQGTAYLDICRRDPSQERFAYGWFANRVLLNSEQEAAM